MWEKLSPPMVIRVVSTILEQELNPCLRKGCCHNVACWWASARKKIKKRIDLMTSTSKGDWALFEFILLIFHLMLIFHFLQIVPQILKHWAIIRILLPAVLHYLVTRIEKKNLCCGVTKFRKFFTIYSTQLHKQESWDPLRLESWRM